MVGSVPVMADPIIKMNANFLDCMTIFLVNNVSLRNLVLWIMKM